MDPSSAEKRDGDGLPPTSAEKTPVDSDESRLLKRKYAQAYRSRRRSQMEQLENLVKNLEAEIAQKNETLNVQEAENSMIRSEIAALERQRDVQASLARSTAEKTEKLTAKVEKYKRKNEAKQRETKNDPNYLKFKEDNKSRYGDALGLFFPDPDKPPQ